ncbi:helix-turn-helix domain-containing protein [Arthrobacter sp. UYEF3]|uniref:helix-turn-helix domain-containing protein n=1 Tax=Arthrobacter sp. UYEF3 TaxID=1756365 RepID=UPI00339737B9
MDQLTTIAAALERMDAGHTKPRPLQASPKTQRYRIADRFSSDELAQLVARYQAGEMSTTLARECGIAKSTFLRLLAERGVDARPRGLTPAKEKEILRLRQQGLIIRDIAKRVGCSYDSAREFLLSRDVVRGGHEISRLE